VVLKIGKDIESFLNKCPKLERPSNLENVKSIQYLRLRHAKTHYLREDVCLKGLKVWLLFFQIPLEEWDRNREIHGHLSY
jgi:hypothetical protein